MDLKNKMLEYFEIEGWIEEAQETLEWLYYIQRVHPYTVTATELRETIHVAVEEKKWLSHMIRQELRGNNGL